MNESKLFYVQLKEHREAADITMEEISDFTKIDIKYLLAIEEGDFSSLPNVYMRLFLRSYCEYIKVDAIKALNDYEFHTIGKIVSDNIAPIDNAQNKELDRDVSIDEDMLNIAPVTKSQIITIVVTIAMLVLAFYLVSSITDSGNDDSQRQDTSDQYFKDSENHDLPDKHSFSPLPNQLLLSSREFDSNPISTKSHFLNTEFPPYIFTIKALAQTKINIDNGGQQIVNKIIEAGEHMSFEVSSVIKFDLWSASHISCKLNDVNLGELFGEENHLVRGSFESKDQKLYYQLHPQFQY